MFSWGWLFFTPIIDEWLNESWEFIKYIKGPVKFEIFRFWILQIVSD
jgi:hypothetical protein